MQLSNNTELQGRKYRIIRVLGQGGFGITYLAENTFFDKLVAIKEFFPKDFCGRDNTSHLTLGTENNAETVSKLKARFLKEAKNIAKLEHPGIVKIHDIFEENNTAYYVMDYIEGENLSEFVKRRGPLSEAKAIEYIRKVGDALDYIHSRQMTHFDVKPANIMVRRSDDTPILIDFGLSKQYDLHGDATSTLMQGVSHGFSPIELYNAGAITAFSPQTDVYSLGATLLYLITGKVPKDASTLLNDGLELPNNISNNLSEAITRAMSPVKRNRTSSVYSFTSSLLMPLQEETIIADSPRNTENEETQFINSQSATSIKQPSQDELRKKYNPSFKNYLFLLTGLVIVFFALIYDCSHRDYFENTQNTSVQEVKDKEFEADGTKIVYSGEVDSEGLPHGRGIAKYIADSETYTYNGEWQHGVSHGNGKSTLPNGDTYEGRWENGVIVNGRFTESKTGHYCIGDIKDGKFTNGTWYNSSGEELIMIDVGESETGSISANKGEISADNTNNLEQKNTSNEVLNDDATQYLSVNGKTGIVPININGSEEFLTLTFNVPSDYISVNDLPYWMRFDSEFGNSITFRVYKNLLLSAKNF